nr:MAG TPA: hypothetical protein [Herelleviridae sp.]
MGSRISPVSSSSLASLSLSFFFLAIYLSILISFSS